MRDDPPKVLDVASRNWSAPVDGFALSVCTVLSEDPDAVSGLSIALRNVGAQPVSVEMQPWLAFYRIEIPGISLTPYGRVLLESQRDAERQTVTLPPGGAVETHVPIGALYPLRKGTPAVVTVTCQPHGHPLSASLSIT